jgi:beta-carotene ketolase (CrtW type)
MEDSTADVDVKGHHPSHLPGRLAVGSGPLFTPPQMAKADYLRAARAASAPKRGAAVAACVVGAWAACLYASLLSPTVASGPPWLRLLTSAGTTWLYTALFITGHDAMHGLVCPGAPRLNHAVGWFCARAFAHLSYRTLLHAHWAHHRHPAVLGRDPDFHDGVHRGAARWFATFMLGYMEPSQLAWMGATTCALMAALPAERVLLGWMAPMVLSSVQLFYFGTYLPHREPDLAAGAPYAASHRTRSDYAKSDAWHLLTCLNFGLHHEHHVLPYVPWWQLHAMRFDRNPR